MHNRVIFSALFFCFALLATTTAIAQDDAPRIKVAIFTPLHLDSAFNSEGKYKLSGSALPKFLYSGLEFYEGAKYAMDSLERAGERIEYYVYDTKAKNKTLAGILNTPLFDSIELIIAHCNAAEAKIFSETGLKRNIPVINATLPNDAGTISNPFWVVLNPTLRAQCEGIYKLTQKHFSLDNIIVFRKKGSLEDRIKTYFEDYSKITSGIKLKLKYVDITDSTSAFEIKEYLDSTTNTTCIAGSLDETFGRKLLVNLATLHSEGYKSTVIGMPTWDGVQLSKPEYKGPEIIYCNPFYNAKTDKTSKSLINSYTKIFKSKPTDMFFRGYETTYRFSKLLLKFKSDVSSNISNKSYNVFTAYDIQPVLNKQTMDLDYFENKNLYFLSWQDGIIKDIY